MSNPPPTKLGGDHDVMEHNADVTILVEDDTDEEDEKLLERRPSAIPIRKGQIAKRSWLPVATTAAASTVGSRGRGRGRR
jgi:hypothetical protein